MPSLVILDSNDLVTDVKTVSKYSNIIDSIFSVPMVILLVSLVVVSSYSITTLSLQLHVTCDSNVKLLVLSG